MLVHHVKFLTVHTLPMPQGERSVDPHQHAVASACLASALRRRFATSVRLNALALRNARCRLRDILKLWRLEIEDVASLLAAMDTLQTAFARHQNTSAVKLFRLQEWTKSALIDIYAGLDQSEKWTEEFSLNTEAVLAEIIAKKEWGQHRLIKSLAEKMLLVEQDKQNKMDKFGAAIRTLQIEKRDMRTAMNECKGNVKSLEHEKMQLKQQHERLAAKLKLAEVDNAVMHDALECIICMQRPATTIFTPCGHRTCHQCSANFTACPHCRTQIQHKFPTKPKHAPASRSAAAEGSKFPIF